MYTVVIVRVVIFVIVVVFVIVVILRVSSCQGISRTFAPRVVGCRDADVAARPLQPVGIANRLMRIQRPCGARGLAQVARRVVAIVLVFALVPMAGLPGAA